VLFAAAAAQAASAPTVLVFGDSLSAGYGIDVDQSWPALLQSRLESQGYEHRVINASISGETTEGGVTRIVQTIIEATKTSGAAVVMLGIRIPTNYGSRYTGAFESVYRELAEQSGVLWIEFFMEGIALNKDLMQDDGIHPNAEAQLILLDNAWPIIRQSLEVSHKQ